MLGIRMRRVRKDETWKRGKASQEKISYEWRGIKGGDIRDPKSKEKTGPLKVTFPAWPQKLVISSEGRSWLWFQSKPEVYIWIISKKKFKQTKQALYKPKTRKWKQIALLHDSWILNLMILWSTDQFISSSVGQEEGRRYTQKKMIILYPMGFLMELKTCNPQHLNGISILEASFQQAGLSVAPEQWFSSCGPRPFWEWDDLFTGVA